MREVFKISFLLLLIFGVGVKGNAQIYTYNPSRPSCDGTWNGDCWDRVNNFTGCTSISLVPNLSPSGGTPCPVEVFVNHNVTRLGDAVFGSTFNKIVVGNNATLTITGDVTISQNRTITFETVGGGKIDIQGSISLNAGTSTVLNINGDKSGGVIANGIDFANNVTVNVNEGGTLLIPGETMVSGKEVELNIRGFFRTDNFTITGNDTRLNVNDPGIVVVDEDFDVTGQGGVVVGGSSQVEVGGLIKVTNNTVFEVEETGFFRACGTHESNQTVPPGVTIGGCRILPVDYTKFEVVQSPNRASTLLRWTTAKEENNEYFEVERSLAGIQDFKVIGQVPGMGWTDTPSEYTFEDRSLPLAGGDVFYRLRQVDFDGKYSFSKAIKVRVQGVNSTRGIWRVHPNPVAGESPKLSLVEASAYTDGPIQIRLIHVSSVMQKAELQSIDQLNESFPQLFSKMPNGLILLEISWGNQVEQIKIMKK